MALESLDTVLAKKDSFSHMWKLMNPDSRFRDQYIPCMRIWNKWSHRAQQRMYWYIREMQRRNETIYDNPLYNLLYITPHPFDCNGRADLPEIIKKCDMVSACYNGQFGIYTRCDATIFEMTHIQPRNWELAQ